MRKLAMLVAGLGSVPIHLRFFAFLAEVKCPPSPDDDNAARWYSVYEPATEAQPMMATNQNN